MLPRLIAHSHIRYSYIHIRMQQPRNQINLLLLALRDAIRLNARGAPRWFRCARNATCEMRMLCPFIYIKSSAAPNILYGIYVKPQLCWVPSHIICPFSVCASDGVIRPLKSATWCLNSMRRLARFSSIARTSSSGRINPWASNKIRFYKFIMIAAAVYWSKCVCVCVCETPSSRG